MAADPTRLAGITDADAAEALLRDGALQVVLGPDGVARAATPSWARLDIDPDALVGAAFWDVIHRADLVTAAEHLGAAAGGAGATTFDARLRVGDGGLRWVQVTARAITPDGDLVVSCAEIDARRAGEAARAASLDELRRRNADLERSNRDLEQFASVASHDMLTPLTATQGALSAVRSRGHSDPVTADLIDVAYRNVRRAVQLSRDLLDYGRVGSGADPATVVDLAALVAEEWETLGGDEGGARLRVEWLPAVRGRPVALAQLVRNLLSNARKFHQVEQPARVWVGGVVTDGGRVRIEVRDAGIGVPPEHRVEIFGLFCRLDRRRDVAGAGIGLATCARIAELHGTSITVEDAPEGGASFAFELERAPDAG